MDDTTSVVKVEEERVKRVPFSVRIKGPIPVQC